MFRKKPKGILLLLVFLLMSAGHPAAGLVLKKHSLDLSFTYGGNAKSETKFPSILHEEV